MKRWIVIALLVAGIAAVGAAPAQAEFGFRALDFELAEEDGSRAAQAGSHPFSATTRIAFNIAERPDGAELPDRQVRQIVTKLPTGFVGDPFATPRCSSNNFAEVSFTTLLPNCPDSAVVGIISARAALQNPQPGEKIGPPGFFPIYNLESGKGTVAQLGAAILRVPVVIDVEIEEEAPYNVVASLKNVPQALQLFDTEVILWGDPAASAHDTVRGSCIDILESGNGNGIISKGSCPVPSQDKPFLTLPRACTGPAEAFFSALSWDQPPASDEGVSVEPNGMQGCSKLAFAPEVDLQPTEHSADSPTGLSFHLDVDDPGLTSSKPGQVANSDMKKTVVTLPEGVALNPAIASGLGACSTADLARETAFAAPGVGCPQSSKIGSVRVETPLLQRALGGSVYVAKQQDNPFGSLLAIYLVIKDADYGLAVKLPGRVDPNPQTGQLVTTFDDLPQVPLSHVELRLREGPRAPLIAPSTCGSYTTKIEMAPWAAPATTVTKNSTFTVSTGPGGSGCLAGPPFSIGLEGGTANPVAGNFSPMFVRLSRPDGTQRMAGVELSLPPGFTGKLAGVPYCPEATIAGMAAQNQPGQGVLQLTNPSCPAASQVGSVAVGAGAGPNPVFVDTGKAYLAGPYKGAPISLAVVTPAVVGPFDLGTVVVRVALEVDPQTARIRAVSDPLPTILHGVPLDLREVRIAVDRPDFSLNPTSCEEKFFEGTAFSATGTPAPLRQRFQVGSCGRLGFNPALKISLKGQMKRSGNPALRAQLTARKGDANIRRTVVLLPVTSLIDQFHINNPCTRAEYAANQCPPKSVLGRARAFSPLLDQPLEGPIYFRSNGGERDLPDVVLDLGGQIHIVQVGFIDAVKGRLRTTFAAVPDAPLSKVVLKFKGGKEGLIENGANLCKVPQRATIRVRAYNGKAKNFNSAIKTSCSKKKSAKSGQHRRRG